MKENQIATIAILIGILLIVGIGFGLTYGVKSFTRQQKVLDAKNEILVNEMKIQQTEQLVKVEVQKAEVKVAEAKGIAEAQNIINATLTDKYLQHEAIMAQEKMSSSPNHTTIYIPSGQNGVPLVTTTN